MFKNIETNLRREKVNVKESRPTLHYAELYFRVF